MLGLCLLCGPFSGCRAGCARFSTCGSQALEDRLNSCAAGAASLYGMLDLPSATIKPNSPALADSVPLSLQGSPPLKVLLSSLSSLSSSKMSPCPPPSISAANYAEEQQSQELNPLIQGCPRLTVRSKPEQVPQHKRDKKHITCLRNPCTPHSTCSVNNDWITEYITCGPNPESHHKWVLNQIKQ